jgi:hypothetical protein
MSKRGKIWLGALGFTVFAWAAMLHAARAADALPPLKVISWIHTFGCPRPASDVVLLVQEGTAIKLVHIKLDTLAKEDQQKLSAMIGDVNGINIVYKCGNDI